MSNSEEPPDQVGADGAPASDSMRRRVQAFDWASTPLGPSAAWSPGLKSLLELLLNARQPMFLAWGPERTWIHNDAFIPIAGRKHPEALGRPAREVWSEAWADLGPLIDRVYAGESIHMTDFTVGLDRDGTVEDAHFDFSSTPIRGERDASVQGLFGVCLETTKRIAFGRTQLAMAERERTRIFEMSQDLIAVASFDGYLKSINPAWSQQLGRSEQALLAMPFSEFIHPEDLAETARVVAALQAGRPVHQFHVRLLRADGSPVAYAWSAVPELEPPNRTFYTVGRDITEELAASTALANAQEALRQSQKMEAVGQLTGGLAHDFNNLLTGMMGNLELLSARVARGRVDGLERFVLAAQGAGRRAAALTQRLLAFSRRQTLDPKPTDINRLIAGMEDLLRQTVGPSITIEVVGAAGLWTANIDAIQLESALLNLCINARDAMPDGGRLTIETANRWLDERGAKERDVPPGQYLAVSVTDTGTGMTQETVERAFEPFYTTKPIGQGTGLGLSMIYGFARQSGGQVRIYSEVGGGASICIYLPRHASDIEIPTAPVHHDATKGIAGRTVLVVDDEETIRDLVLEVLGGLDYTVITAADGPSGLKLLQAGTRVDLLITDVGLPNGLNGRQVADAARSLQPAMKVLFITGYAENAAFGNGHLAPGMELLTKPFTLDALAIKVAQILEVDR